MSKRKWYQPKQVEHPETARSNGWRTVTVDNGVYVRRIRMAIPKGVKVAERIRWKRLPGGRYGLLTGAVKPGKPDFIVGKEGTVWVAYLAGQKRKDREVICTDPTLTGVKRQLVSLVMGGEVRERPDPATANLGPGWQS